MTHFDQIRRFLLVHAIAFDFIEMFYSVTEFYLVLLKCVVNGF